MNDERPSDVVRTHVIYSGHVQGVCFRMTTREIARGYEVAGYVRNLTDGTVELEAQGAPDEVDRFLAAIKAEFVHHITGVDADAVPPQPGGSGFRIA